MITITAPPRTLELPAPTHPYTSHRRPSTEMVITESGVIHTLVSGASQLVVEMRFTSLTAAEFSDIETFIQDTLLYSAFPCTLVDPGGRHENMHYVSGLERAEIRKGDLWALSLRFEQGKMSLIPLGSNLISNPNLRVDGGKIAGWDISPDRTPAAIRNVETGESFSPTALEVEDTDADIEWFISTPKIPIADLRYVVSGRLSRTSGNRGLWIYVTFFDSDGSAIDSTGTPRTGWAYHAHGHFYYFGHLAYTDSNDAWVSYSTTFGPGSTTYVPPAAKFFQIGTFIIASGNGDGEGNVTGRFSDFSIVESP